MAPFFTGLAKNLGGYGFGRLSGAVSNVYTTISVVLWGGGGTSRDPLYGGGSGGFVSATVPYATYSGQTFYIVVGQGGVGGTQPNPTKAGGFGGGGPSGSGGYANGSGGGASYIRLTNGSGTVLLVAGAGGGGNGYAFGPLATSGPPQTSFAQAGGRGGGPSGEGAATYDNPGGVGAGGGTQVAGGKAGDGKTPGLPGTAGSFLQGGTGGNSSGGAGGGGGGGYYGGGGGGGSDPTRVASNGGGGSGYVNPTWTAITNSYSPNPYTAYPHPLAIPGIAIGGNNTLTSYNGQPGYIVITLQGTLSPEVYTFPYTGSATTFNIP